MGSPFDGMAEALTGIFGESVTLIVDGVARSVHGVLRHVPVEMIRDGGQIGETLPVLRIAATDAAGLKAGRDLVIVETETYGFSRNPRPYRSGGGLVEIELEIVS
ncbi:hypothetical protein SAMN06273572_10246 [Monaibacterium marinum]|uniref:Uncharacterized protein n=1 Tax=Pontivivens marinum TaxID=1690039 RepID=A0A2C9CQ74_9RHOB|nr:hypothetical protein [Monaibacterium marinum]SOH93370.1 hypothetical protein SAMN06273572_10246 [Monaibacterium marinum]